MTNDWHLPRCRIDQPDADAFDAVFDFLGMMIRDEPDSASKDLVRVTRSQLHVILLKGCFLGHRVEITVPVGRGE